MTFRHAGVIRDSFILHDSPFTTHDSQENGGERKKSLPLHEVKVLTGLKECRVVEDPLTLGKIIKKAERPLLVFGQRCL
jgi:hypothetical protein